MASDLWLLDDLVDDAILLGLVDRHEVVAVGVFFDFGERLAGVFGENLVEPVANLENVIGADLHVDGLPLGAAHHLMDHDFGVRQGVAFAWRAGGKQRCPH